MNIKTRILTLTAAGSIVIAGVVATAGYAAAQEPDSTPGATRQEQRAERRDNFLTRVATHLNVTLEQLKDAFKSAASEALADAVANGNITQEQADKIQTRIESGERPGLRAILRKGGRDGALLQRVRAGIIKSSATALEMSPEDLVAELRSGKSIADVAGDDVDAVKTQITADATAKLDAAVAANKLTRAQADRLLERLEQNLDSILNKTRGQQPAQ